MTAPREAIVYGKVRAALRRDRERQQRERRRRIPIEGIDLALYSGATAGPDDGHNVGGGHKAAANVTNVHWFNHAFPVREWQEGAGSTVYARTGMSFTGGGAPIPNVLRWTPARNVTAGTISVSGEDTVGEPGVFLGCTSLSPFTGWTVSFDFTGGVANVWEWTAGVGAKVAANPFFAFTMLCAVIWTPTTIDASVDFSTPIALTGLSIQPGLCGLCGFQSSETFQYATLTLTL